MGITLDTVVVALRTTTQAALAATAAGAPARVCDTAGQVAWDSCECGLLAVTVTRLYPSRTFPVEISGIEPAVTCPPPYLVADLAITVLRCAPGPDRAGNAPTCDQLTAATLTWLADMDATRRAVACCAADLRATGTIEEYVLRDQTPLGPEGGCVGSETHLYVGVANPVCVVT